MPSFKPKNLSSVSEVKEQSLINENIDDIDNYGLEQNTVKPNSEIISIFKKDIIQQINRMINDTLRNITRNRSYFREEDIVRGVYKIAQKEFENKLDILENPRLRNVIEELIKDFNLINIGFSQYKTTKEVFDIEKEIIELSGALTPAHRLPADVVDRAIKAKVGISEEQIAAVYAATMTGNRVTVIEGTAGAGKSFTMKAIKDAYVEMGYEVMGTALGWNAAKVLESSAGLGDCMALEGLVRKMLAARDSGTSFFRRKTLLIVDEAGMVGSRHMKHILEETARSKFPVKIVLTGDSLQVNPVDAGNALAAIIAFHGTVRIDTIRRQSQESQRVAVKQLSQRQSGKAMHTYLNQELIHWAKNKESLFNLVVRDFVSYKNAYPNKKSLILALENKDVVALNSRIRKAYKKAGFIDSYEVTATVTDGRETWDSQFSIGDEVVLRANSKDLVVYKIEEDKSWKNQDQWKVDRYGAFNRNSGTIVGIKRSKEVPGSFDFMVDMGGDTPGRVIINSSTFKHTERKGMPMVHNFATTIYASQGQTVDKVFFIDSPMMEFRLAYVGMSRHREGLEIYLDETELHHRMDKMIGRASKFVKRQDVQQTTHWGAITEVKCYKLWQLIGLKNLKI
jgi:ATP-dependent exoDNAse (exonuclease V) alpha subunit